MITFSDFQLMLDLPDKLKYPEDLTPLAYELFYDYYLLIGGLAERPKTLSDIKKIKGELGC